MKIGKYDWTNVKWEKSLIQEFKDIQYMVLFFTYVLIDVFTTVRLIDHPLITELNPIVNFIFTIPLGFILFYMIKHISLEIIFIIIRFQNEKIKNSGYITYLIILIMSLYVGINNIILLIKL